MGRKNSQGGGRKQKAMLGRCIFTIVPPEMFINICQNLPPVDLLSLARVCKRFNGFLSSEVSMTTQEIWRASRERFLQFLQMPPPDGMTERQYIRLVLERGCQFCGKTKIRKVYWEFLVRCCEDCLKERTLRQEDIKQDMMRDVLRADDVLSGLPFIPSWHRRAWDRGTKTRPSSLYWTKDVISAYEEYQKIPDHPYDLKNQWVKKKREEGVAKMKEINMRKLENDKELRNKIQQNSIKRSERALQIQSKLHELKSEKNEYGILIYSEALTETSSYKNAMNYMSRKSPQPFTDRAWVILKKKLMNEYNEISESKRQQRIEKEKSLQKDIIIQMRQFDIYQIAKQWIPDPETDKKIESLTYAALLNSSSSNSSVSINNDSSNTDNNMANDTPSIKVEGITSVSDFAPVKVESTTSISDNSIKVEDTSMNVDSLTSTSDTTPMKIDNLISTSDTTSMNVDMSDDTTNDLTLMSADDYINITSIPDMSHIYFPMPTSNPNTTIINDAFSYSSNNDAPYSTDTNSIMSIDSLISHDTFNFGLTSTAASSSITPIYTDVLYCETIDGDDQFPWIDLTSSSSMDDYFNFNPTNVQQDESRLIIEKYLPWCPSFKNPPFHDDNPYNLWDENYLMKTLMPQIWCEATHLLNNFGPTTPVQTLQDAVLGSYREYNMYKCKVCVAELAKEQRLIYDDKKLRSYRDARLHLLSFHAIRNINDDEMIEFVPDVSAGYNPDPVFNNDIKNKLFSIGYNFNLLDDLVKY